MVKTADEALGIDLRVRLHVDAAAALGILDRQGGGRLRRLDIGVLWLQEQQLCWIIELTKVWGQEKPAYLMTKHLAQDLSTKSSTVLGYRFRGGRATTTAQLHGVVGKEAGDPVGAPEPGASISEGLGRSGRWAGRDVDEGHDARTQGGQAKGSSPDWVWECLSPVHWRLTLKGGQSISISSG